MLHHLHREGVTLAYDEVGRGAPPLVLLHGALGNHRHLARQAAHFRRQHRVVAPDLRGHGASDRPAQDYTVAGFADDLAWLCHRLGLVRPVVVGHSLGGLVALDLARRYPEVPVAIVLLDAPVLGSRALAASPRLQAFLDALQTPAYRDAVRVFMGGTFLASDDPERRARLLAQMSAAPQHVAASVFRHCFHYDVAAGDAIRVPALYIRAAGSVDLTPLRQVCPQLLTGQTVGAGHFHHLDVPDQVNAMIARFLRLVGVQTPAEAPPVLDPRGGAEPVSDQCQAL